MGQEAAPLKVIKIRMAKFLLCLPVVVVFSNDYRQIIVKIQSLFV